MFKKYPPTFLPARCYA